jgi:glutathione S-transferase
MRSIRVRWTLQELGVDFESVTVNMLAASGTNAPRASKWRLLSARYSDQVAA